MKFKQWVHEIAAAPGFSMMPDQPYKRSSQSSLEKLIPQKQLQPAGPPEEPAYDPHEEEVSADLIEHLQKLLDVMDRDRSDAVAVQQGLAKIAATGRIYLKYLEGK